MKTLATVAIALLMFQSNPHATSQETPSASPSFGDITFHTSSDLVLVDVIALTNGLPDKILKRGDLEVFDNGRPVSIMTFDSGAQFTTRPLALWFVVLCNMQGYEKQGSGLFARQIDLFRPALKYVEKQDTVAVAHWCDDGQSKLDLLPTSNVEDAATALEQVLAPVPDTSSRTSSSPWRRWSDSSGQILRIARATLREHLTTGYRDHTLVKTRTSARGDLSLRRS